MEDILDAAARIGDEVHVAVRIRHTLERLAEEITKRSLEAKVEVLKPVSPAEIVSALSGFDVGLITNRPITTNDELVYPNKLFEYMMAGLAIVAPRLPSLAATIEGERIGLTYDPGNPDDLARKLTQLAADQPLLEAMKRRARELAVNRYNATAQEPVLLRAWGL